MARVQAISEFTPEVEAEENPLEQLRQFVEPPQERVVVKRVMPDREILAAMTGLGSLLAVRLILALAVVGAFILAFLAMSSTNAMAIWVLLAYAATVILPLTYLSTKRT